MVLGTFRQKAHTIRLRSLGSGSLRMTSRADATPRLIEARSARRPSVQERRSTTCCRLPTTFALGVTPSLPLKPEFQEALQSATALSSADKWGSETTSGLKMAR